MSVSLYQLPTYDLKMDNNKWLVTIGISRAHVHLSQQHVEELFGQGYHLKVLRELGQAGQFACKETVTVVGPKGVLQKVRIIGPARAQTQVELSRTDTFTVGIDAPYRNSGDLRGTPGCVLVGPEGMLILEEGCMIAKAHIHLLAQEAKSLGLADRDQVDILIKGEKTVSYNDVLVRLVSAGMTEFHIDTDEANAAGVDTGDLALIKHKEIVIKDGLGNIREVDADNIRFVQSKGPQDRYFQEGMRILRTVFEYSASEQQEMTQKVLDNGKMVPNQYYIFMALEKDKVIGVACFYWMHRACLAYLEHICILPEYRNRGIGSFFYHKVVSFMEKNHPEIEGMLLEVSQTREGLDARKHFFLNLGAIPVDTNFYPSDRLKLGQELMLMFKPETVDARLNTAIMEKVLQTLVQIL
ncbi:phosphate propanoyltransferase [Peptococcaceae bacterium CEB3]|nr:phosphate propanoyltransferase [Peptococcaceae bacterium CEB3]